MKKLRSLVITVALLLLMAEENIRALPLSGMARGQYESHTPEEGTTPPASIKAGSVLEPPKGEATVGKQSGAVTHKRQYRRRNTRRKTQRASATERARARLKTIKIVYKRRTRKSLVITSLGRTPAQQAHAMLGLIKRHGDEYVRNLYLNKPAVNEILTAYLENLGNPQQAEREMTRVIEAQIARDVFISKHLRGLAADIRRHGKGAARLSVLRAAAGKVGATVLVEPECYHLNLV
jgi:hypothetical protein